MLTQNRCENPGTSGHCVAKVLHSHLPPPGRAAATPERVPSLRASAGSPSKKPSFWTNDVSYFGVGRPMAPALPGVGFIGLQTIGVGLRHLTVLDEQ